MGILIKAPARRREQPAGAGRGFRGPGRSRAIPFTFARSSGSPDCAASSSTCGSAGTGFPAPLRDGFGDRVYPPDQVARLKLIKQLLSEGWRAGAVVPLTESVLQSMLGLTVEDPAPLPGRDRVRRQASRAAPHRRVAEPPVEAAGGAGDAQVPRGDAHSAERGRARARRARRNGELPGAALRRSRRSGCSAT